MLNVYQFLKLCRPTTSGLAAFAVLCAMFIEVNLKIINLIPLTILAIVSIFCFVSGGNAINDYFDREIDKINHPERPIPSGKVKSRQALIFAIFLFAISIILSGFINFYASIIVLIAFLFQIFYEIKLKKYYITKNFTIAILTAILFIFGGIVIYNEIKISPSFILGIIVFFAIFGREIIKDIEDFKGDSTRFTIPKKIGIKKAAYLSTILILFSIALSPLPYFILNFNILYLILVSITDIIFIHALTIQIKNPKQSRKNIKIGMFIALIGFLFGSLAF